MIIYIKMMIINPMIPSLICLFKIKINLAIDYTKVICIDFFYCHSIWLLLAKI